MKTKTIPALLYKRYLKTPDGIAHYSLDANGKWQPHTWKECFSDVTRFAKGLMDMGLTTGQNIGIMAPASRQWDVFQIAILFCGGVVVGLDPHDSSENINNIAKRTNLSGLVVGDVALLEKFDDSLLNKMKFIISLSDQAGFSSQSGNISPIKELLTNEASGIETHFSIVEKSSPATIIFTSGTTGTPKGILYTHDQVIIACDNILAAFSDINEESRLVCWLPLSNLYQRIINYCAIVVGATTYYAENPRQVLQYLPGINPHIFLGVPRFYEKLHEGILENISKRPAIIRQAANWALKAGAKYAKCIRENKSPGFVTRISYQTADFLVLSRIRSLMGNNLKYMISGSAPISQWLMEQFHAMGFLLLEAYGISENIIPIAVNRPDSFKLGTVGKPLPVNKVKLADDGELLVKGPGIFSGNYYKNETTERPLSHEGFLATGDYAKFDTDGFLVLTGRKSEIFKTSTGRRVSPVKIESLISRLPYVEHTVIFGAGKPFLIALLSLDLNQLREHNRQHQKRISEDAAAISDECCDLIKDDVQQQVSPLQGYMHPGGLLLTGEPFTIEGGELTANLKIRRKHIVNKYKKQIDTLYNELEQKKLLKIGDSSPAQKFVIHVL